MGFVAVGAFVGAFTAAYRGGNVLKGAAIGGLAGYVGGQLAAGQGAATPATVEAGGTIGATTAEAAGAGAMDGVTELMATDFGAVNPSGLIESAAPSVVDTGVGVTQSAASAPETALGADVAPATAPKDVITAPPAGTAPTAPTAPTPQSPSLVKQAMDWARANPHLAAGVLQAGGSTLAGIGQGAGAFLTEQQKLENQKKLTEYYRRFIQSGSAGGKGVNLGMAPKPTAGLIQQGLA